jgi:Rha family phage regulatory protein
METTSRIVAEHFGRAHRDVLTAIRNLKCSNKFHKANFLLSEFKDDKNRSFPEYVIQQDGYLLLVMTFTNAKTTRYKEDLILDYKLPVPNWASVGVENQV